MKRWMFTCAGLAFATVVAACGGRVADIPGEPTPTTPEPTPQPDPAPTPGPAPTPTLTPTPAPAPAPAPAKPQEPPAGLPPTHDVPCSAGGTAELSFQISAGNMKSGGGDPSGAGWCFGTVVFNADLSQTYDADYPDYVNNTYVTVPAQANGRTQCQRSPGVFHCGNLVYASGKRVDQYCSIYALCENGLARATSFTW